MKGCLAAPSFSRLICCQNTAVASCLAAHDQIACVVPMCSCTIISHDVSPTPHLLPVGGELWVPSADQVFECLRLHCHGASLAASWRRSRSRNRACCCADGVNRPTGSRELCGRCRTRRGIASAALNQCHADLGHL